MDAFIANISSFPTAIFTTVNVVIGGYWMLMVIGFLDLDCLDFDVDVDTESDDVGGVAGILVKLGLVGVPFTIVLTVIVLASFVLCYYAVYFGLLLTSQGWLHALTGIAILSVSFFLSLPITAIVIKPLKRVFARFDAELSTKSLLGATCTIRTSSVDTVHGEAECTVNGASLIIKVRSDDTPFKHGDKAIIIEHDSDANVYHIVAVAQFNS